jgi:hypothetical protein
LIYDIEVTAVVESGDAGARPEGVLARADRA